jgi:Pentapeptide repeats (8 copies)
MIDNALPLLTIVLVVIGLGVTVAAWVLARHAADAVRGARSSILAGLGSGLLTGSAVTFGAALLQQAITDSAAESIWRSSVVNSWKIAGFDPRGHSLTSPTSIDFSGKELPDARFDGGLDLRGFQFRDASLLGANFDDSHLEHANLVNADLSTASLRGTHLEGALLQSAKMSNARVEHAYFEKTIVDSHTCWPAGFLGQDGVAQLEARGLIAAGKPGQTLEPSDFGKEAPCS